MADLHLATDLALPIDLVTEPIGILANRGRGKTYATHVLVEEIHDAGVPVVILDVKGDWWGVRSSADGTAEGMPFYIFGGDHADLPLEPTAGELLADLVVDERVSVVLDLSRMSKTKARAFTTVFAERLYHRNREPIFLVVDEADVLIPQRQAAETARLIGAMEDLAKRGRGRGIGMAVVTQRPQEVAKSVLDLMETLLLMGMTGRLALKSVGEWTNIHVDDDDPAAVMRELPTMQVGEAWVWSPLHGILQRIRVRALRTFDSHPAPKAGERRTTPKRRTVLDLAALGERISETIEKAKADDPKVLRARIRDLEKQLAEVETAHGTALIDIADLRDELTAEQLATVVEVPAITEAELDRFSGLAGDLMSLLATVEGGLERLSHDLTASVQRGAENGARRGAQTSLPSRPTANAGPTRPASSATREGGPASTAGRAQTTRAATHPAGQGTNTNGSDLTKPEQRVLDAIAWLEGVGFPEPTKLQTGFIAGYRVGKKVGGTFGNILGTLRSRGLIDYPGTGTVRLTDLGRGDATPADIEQTTAGLQAAIFDRLAEPERRVLAHIVDAYPVEMSKQEAGQLAGYAVGAKVGGTFGNILGRLRSLGLIDYPGPGFVVATEVLFLDGAR